MANGNFPLDDEPELKKPGWLAWLRGRFFAGVFVAAPIAITVMIVLWLISVIDNRVKPLIPPALNIESYTDFAIPGFGVVVAVLLLTLLGAITTNLLGRSAVSISDRLLTRIPVVRNIYSLFKQLFDTIQSSNQASFRDMVLVEYPKRGTWALGFVTAPIKGEIKEKLPEGYMSVFVPTTPNPTSGFYMFVLKDEVIDLDMSVEDGAKMIVSVGMVVPENVDTKKLGTGLEEAARRSA